VLPPLHSKAAFYLLIIGTILGGLALVIGFLAHRVAFLLAAVLAFLGFLLTIAGCIIWVVILSRVRSSINGNGSGVNVSYGNALWIYFASSGCLLFATLPCTFCSYASRTFQAERTSQQTSSHALRAEIATTKRIKPSMDTPIHLLPIRSLRFHLKTLYNFPLAISGTLS
jgi:hypothetical protein